MGEPSTVSKGGVTPSTITLSEREFQAFQEFIREVTGISLPDSKQLMLHRRLSGRIREKGLGSFGAYLSHLKTGDATELEVFSNAITTNLTSFFRENHHFDALGNRILPEIVDKKQNAHRRMRLWSAGCSTGEEPYCIAMVMRETLVDLDRWDARILATDLDSNVLSTCRAGLYPPHRQEGLSPERRRRWFDYGGENGSLSAKPTLKDLITFNQLNLMHQWPMRGKFDVIFCRNVIIYFDKPTQRILVDRYADVLEKDGYLILGHSESLLNVSDRFELVGQTIYRRVR